MATNITARLSSLRKEKGLSQKEAAAGLGVSQALLSHYENGIRECGLDFLCRANFLILLVLIHTNVVDDVEEEANNSINPNLKIQCGAP